MSQAFVTRAFAGGELAPTLAARADLAAYTTGLRRCRNFCVQRHGGVANRPGFRYIASTKTHAPGTQLLRYVGAGTDPSVLIEAGIGYLRFYVDGALVTVDPGDVDAWDGATDFIVGDLAQTGGVVYYAIGDSTGEDPTDSPDVWYAFDGDVYELPTPFSAAMRWHQSGRVITLTEHGQPPHELIFYGLTQWLLWPVLTIPLVPAPEGLTLAAGSGARHYGYLVTAAAPGTYEESAASAQVISAAAAAPTPDAPHTVTWDAVLVPPVLGPPAPEYYVYADPFGNGTYGYIGTATGATVFRNPGLEPDFNLTPPIVIPRFVEPDQYPAVSATHQQRRFFANTIAEPDAVIASRIGLPSNFGISTPLQDDDAISFTIAGNTHHPVQHLVSLKAGLVLLTEGGEWTARGVDGRAFTPNGIDLEQETYNGAAPVPPVVVGNAILYVQGRGAIVRDLRFDEAVEGLAGRDLTVFASHLFDGYTIVSLAYAQTPHSTIWAVRSDGVLLGLTYLREQAVWGWHRHDTIGGAFEAVIVLPAPGEDALYAIVRRTIGGATRRYLERLAPRTILPGAVAAAGFFVDSGLSYHGSPISVAGGLDHLEGQTVAVCADGVSRGTRAVQGGAVALGGTYTDVHVGLPITADLETLDLDVAGSGLRDKKKRVASVTLLLDQSARTFHVGPTLAALLPYTPPTYDPTGPTYTGPAEITVLSRFTPEGRVWVRHTDPTPLTVLAIVPQTDLGG